MPGYIMRSSSDITEFADFARKPEPHLSRAAETVARTSQLQDAISPVAKIVLDPPEGALLVQTGHVDIFAVEQFVDSRQATPGSRHLLLRRSAGAVFAFAPLGEDLGYTLVLEAGPGTRIVLVDPCGYGEPGSPVREAWQVLVKEWVAAWTELVGAPPPEIEQLYEVQPANIVAARHGAYAQRRLRELLTRRVTEEVARLERRIAHDRSRLVSVNHEFERLLSRRAERRTHGHRTHWESVFNACAEAALAAGVTLAECQPKDIAAGELGKEIEAILAASGIRMREVRLVENWWHHDSGPLVGTLREDGRAVALVPGISARYVLIDPQSGGARRRLTNKTAALVGERAYSLLPGFPAGLLKKMQLVRFGLRAQWRTVTLMTLAAVAAGLLGLTVPTIMGRVVDTVIPGASFVQLRQFILVLTAAAVASTGFNLFQGVCIQRLRGHLTSKLEAAIWDRLLSLPVAFFRGYTAGDLANRALGIDTLNTTLTSATLMGVFSSLFSLMGLAVMLYYSWELALYGLAVAAVALIFGGVTARLKIALQKILAESTGQLSGRVWQFVVGIAKLKVAGAERRAFTQWGSDYARQAQQSSSILGYSNFITVFKATFSPATSLLLFLIVACLTSMPAIGDFIAFNAAFMQFMAGVSGIVGSLGSSIGVTAVYERARPILETVPETDAARLPPQSIRGFVEVSHVTYSYDPLGPPAVEDVSFEVRPGEFVAICGRSGSGKSTLLRLLLGFATPAAGTVAYDGQSLANLSAPELRRRIGVVLNSSQLIPGTLLMNITNGDDYTLAEAWEAARLVGLDEDIAALPMRMHTYVPGGGMTFSVGQRQKILLARALVRRPRILLLDEATSALDNASQKLVTRNLEKLTVSRVVIAHRLTTIREADKILVMERGRLLQRGRFEELLTQPGVFADIARRQQV